MHCEIYSDKYDAVLEFWRHGDEIKVRSSKNIHDLPYLHHYDGRTLCNDGKLQLEGSVWVYGFCEDWSQEQFYEACSVWWWKFMRRVQGLAIETEDDALRTPRGRI